MRFSQLRNCCAGFQTSHDSKLHKNCSFPFFMCHATLPHYPLMLIVHLGLVFAEVWKVHLF